MIKKFTLVVLSNLLIVLFLTGCGKKEENTTSSNTTTSTTNTQTQIKQDTPPPPKVSQAEETVKNWINALGNRNFKEAHGLMTSKKGGDYSKFSSTIGYGGINKTNILSCKVDTESESSAEVVAEYESFDPVNRDGKFKQRFILVKEGNDWRISEIKKIDISFYNEKKTTEKENNITTTKKDVQKTVKEEKKPLSFVGNWTASGRILNMYSNGTFFYKEEGMPHSAKGTWSQKANKVTLETESFTNQMIPGAHNTSTFGKGYISDKGSFVFDGVYFSRK